MKGEGILIAVLIALIIGFLFGCRVMYDAFDNAGWCPKCKDIRIHTSDPTYCSKCGTEIIYKDN